MIPVPTVVLGFTFHRAWHCACRGHAKPLASACFRTRLARARWGVSVSSLYVDGLEEIIGGDQSAGPGGGETHAARGASRGDSSQDLYHLNPVGSALLACTVHEHLQRYHRACPTSSCTSRSTDADEDTRRRRAQFWLLPTAAQHSDATCKRIALPRPRC